ncbi:hypothetical protein PFISCL1PPCAC_10654, partial [Pristionchus fissidentatus]
VVCIKKQSTARRLRSSYGPAYAFRGATTYGLNRPGLPDSSYEDHLEKAARLSSEMTAYNQTGRVSLYGSYWNLNNHSPGSSQTTAITSSSSGERGERTNQARSTAVPYTNPAYSGTTQRYAYSGRY